MTKFGTRFGRLITAMVTPFGPKGEVDYAQAKKLALALIKSGSDGVVISGTTGESPTLTREEKLRLFSEIKQAVGNSGTVIAGTGSYSTEESIKLTRDAEETGVDASLLVVPYYNKPTQAGLVAHFTAIAAATRLPCILYNVPGRTVTNLEAETVLSLSRVDNIIGVKEASANFEQAARIVQGVHSDFLVYSGNDGDTLPLMSLGACGVISVASHLVGNQIKAMMDLFLKGNTAQAAAEHRRLLPLVNALFVMSNPIPVKYALNRLGFNVGQTRLPLTPPDDQTAARIDGCLKDYKMDLPV